MRRENRKITHSKSIADKIIIYSIIGILLATIVLIGLVIYSKTLSDDVREGTMTLEQMTEVANKEKEKTENASTEMGKTIEEAKKENKSEKTDEIYENIEMKKENDNKNNKEKSKNDIKIEEKKKDTTVQNKTKSTATVTKKVKKEEKKKEISFIKPVEGEIMKDYAKENLIYSETLKEWVTHLGIDIKAKETTMVKSAEAGVVKKIKNDPRYGLTVVVEHENGFETVYSNLLTAEFVVENEKVEKGQSLGTVGNTASFESVEESHLHFEIKKDGLNVDPKIYLK